MVLWYTICYWAAALIIEPKLLPFSEKQLTFRLICVNIVLTKAKEVKDMLAIIAALSDVFYFVKKFIDDIIVKLTGKEEE